MIKFERTDSKFERRNDLIEDFLIKSQDPFYLTSDPTDAPLSAYNLVLEHCWVMMMPGTLSKVWGPCCDQILIWSEYGEAEAVVMLAIKTKAQGFLVSGQPSIDLSLFCALFIF